MQERIASSSLAVKQQGFGDQYRCMGSFTGSRQINSSERRVILHLIWRIPVGNFPNDIALVQIISHDTAVGGLEEFEPLRPTNAAGTQRHIAGVTVFFFTRYQ